MTRRRICITAASTHVAAPSLKFPSPPRLTLDQRRAAFYRGRTHAQHRHLLRRHRQRDFREHFQCAEAPSLPAQDEKTQPQEQRGWPMVERRDLLGICPTLADERRGKKSPTGGRRCPHGSSSSFIVHSARSWNLASAAASPARAAAAATPQPAQPRTAQPRQARHPRQPPQPRRTTTAASCCKSLRAISLSKR